MQEAKLVAVLFLGACIPAFGSCSASLVTGIDCYGNDLRNELATSTSDCCSKCKAFSGCKAFSFRTDSKQCYLKSACKSQASDSAVVAGLYSSPAPTCPASYLKETDCYGEDITNQAASSSGECCRACDGNSACKAFTYGDGICWLKSGCSNRVANTVRKSGLIDSYTVSSGSFNVNGYQCADGNPKTHIFYPKGTGPFGIVTFGHGMGGDLDIGKAALKTVAALGVIVVAPGTGGSDEECSSYEWQDMLLALSTAKSGGTALHAALGKVDWSRAGVWGYSMGGKTAPSAASQAGYNIKAMLAMHGARHAVAVSVPSMFTTGSADALEGPSKIKPEFFEAPAMPKIYLNLKGATHTEPISPGRLNIWGGRFLACHVAGRTRQCDVVYGTGAGTLCSSNDFVECIVQKASAATVMVV